MNKLLTAMVVSGGMFLAGCAGLGVRQSPPPLVATFDERGMTGPNVSLQRDGSTIRGSAYGRAVSLEWSGTGVKGSYRSMPVKLAVVPAGEAMKVDGEFDGEAAAFQYARGRVEGYLSGCAFLLERGSGNRLEGKRACRGKKPEGLRVAVPLQLANRSETERAAWIALLLTDESVEPAFARAQFVMSVERQRRPVTGGCRKQ